MSVALENMIGNESAPSSDFNLPNRSGSNISLNSLTDDELNCLNENAINESKKMAEKHHIEPSTSPSSLESSSCSSISSSTDITLASTSSSQSPDGFYIAAPTRIAASSKESSLFRFIKHEKTLLETKGYKITSSKNTARFAFFIDLTTVHNASFSHLYSEQGYQCVERHLTVDKSYAKETSEKGVRGYSYAHYTEKHCHTNDEIIIVHVYFNELGEFINAQAKHVSTDTYTAVAEQNKIKKNARDASIILLALLRGKAQKHNTAVYDASELEKKLITLSFELGQNDARKDYVSMAKKYSEQIERINLYSDSRPSTKGKLIMQIAQFLTNNTPTSATASIPMGESRKEETLEITNNSDIVNSAENCPSVTKEVTPPIISIITTQENELNKFISASNTSIEHQIKILEKVRDLQDSLLDYIIKEGLTKKASNFRKKTIDRIAKKINKVQTFSELLNKSCSKGDLESFKKLFSFDEYQVTSLESLSKILCTATFHSRYTASNKGRIAICEYLFENSENYRQYILCPLGDNQFMKPFYPVFEGASVSALILATFSKNLTAFKMLMAHGYDVNQYDLKYQGGFISALRTCILFCDNDLTYINLLLENGALINKPHTREITDLNPILATATATSNTLQLAMLALIERARSADDPSNALKNPVYEHAFEDTSDLVFACKIGKLLTIPTLCASNTHTLRDLAIAMSVLACEKHVKKIRIYSAKNHGVVFSTSNSIQEIVEGKSINSSAATFTGKIQMVIFSEIVDPEATHARQALYNAFIHKYQHSPSEIGPAITVLTELVKKYVASKKQGFGDCYYLAALFLIIQKGVLSLDDVKHIMKLENYIASMHKGISNSLCVQYCQNAIAAAERLGHIDTLRDDPLFKLTNIQLNAALPPTTSTLPAYQAAVSNSTNNHSSSSSNNNSNEKKNNVTKSTSPALTSK